MSTNKATWFCAECGSLDIRHEAEVVWDPEKEDWEVVGVLDGAHCEACMCADKYLENQGMPVWGIPSDERKTAN